MKFNEQDSENQEFDQKSAHSKDSLSNMDVAVMKTLMGFNRTQSVDVSSQQLNYFDPPVMHS